MTDHKLLKQMAEEAIYSAKGHFKSSDWIGYCLFLLIVVPFITSSVILIFDVDDFWTRVLAFVGAVFSMLAIVYSFTSNQPQAKKRIEQHMTLGNQYLGIYSEIRELVMTNSQTPTKIQRLRKDLHELNVKTSNCKITFFGRWHSKIVIHNEVDTKWLYE